MVTWLFLARRQWPSTWEAEADRVDLNEFKASLVYRVSSRTARTVSQRNPVSTLPSKRERERERALFA